MNTESRELYSDYYEDTKNTGSRDLTKVLIGAVAGAAVGSLIAGSFTQKGIEIRNRVGEGSKNMASNLKEKVSDMSEVVADKYEAAKEGAAGLIEKGKEKIGMSSRSNNAYSSNSYSSNTGYSDTADTDESPSVSQILLGALIVSVASTIVWSFATEKGSETRRRIARGSKDMAGSLKDKVTNAASDIKEGLTDVYESAKDGAVDLLEQEKQRLRTSE